MGKRTVREVDRVVDTGRWKKRRPLRNRVDRERKMLPCESKLTSIWSFMTREFGQPRKEQSRWRQTSLLKQERMLVRFLTLEPSGILLIGMRLKSMCVGSKCVSLRQRRKADGARSKRSNVC